MCALLTELIAGWLIRAAALVYRLEQKLGQIQPSNKLVRHAFVTKILKEYLIIHLRNDHSKLIRNSIYVESTSHMECVTHV